MYERTSEHVIEVGAKKGAGWNVHNICMRETNAAAFNTRPLYCWSMVLLPCWTRVCRRLAGNHSVCSWALFQGFENGLLKSMGKLTAKHNCVSMLGFSLFFRLPCNHLQALGHSCAHNSTAIFASHTTTRHVYLLSRLFSFVKHILFTYRDVRYHCVCIISSCLLITYFITAEVP